MKIYYGQNKKCHLEPISSISPFVLVDDSFDLVKAINTVIGTKQKVNEENEPLFIKDVMKTIEKEVMVGYDDTTLKVDKEGNPLEPFMIMVQKENDECDKLYYKINEEGEKVETTEVTDEPVMIEVQRLTADGRPVFKMPIMKTYTESIKVGEEETTEFTNNPIMIDLFGEVKVSILENPQLFTIDEVLAEKVKLLKEKYDINFVYDEFIDKDNSDTDINTGLNMIEIPAGESITLKTKTLSKSCNHFVVNEYRGDEQIIIYVGGHRISNFDTKISSELKSMTVRLTNPTEELLKIHTILVTADFVEMTEVEKLKLEVSELKETNTTLESKMNDMQSVLDDMLLGGMM